MVKGGFTIISIAAVLAAAMFLVSSAGSYLQLSSATNPEVADEDIVFVSEPVVQEVPPSPAPPKPAATLTRVGGTALPPGVEQMLESGVLIVISTASQQMYVFENGELWDSSPVSTGKRGKETPAGIFPILQKRTFHRSNIYSNAPMPHMQRLTWTGIAIHAGKLPGYPASHGCIRLPADFARALFKLTRPETTTVVVTDQHVGSLAQARLAALNMPVPLPGERGHLIQRPEPMLAELEEMPAQEAPTRVAASEPVSRPVDLLERTRPRAEPTGPRQTIQLAASLSPGEAEAHWSRMVSRFPELDQFEKAIIPAKVGAQQYYRLRVTGPGANASCNVLRRSGADCFPVK